MKVVFVLFRKHGLTHDESLAQWKGEQHTSIVRMIPGLKRWAKTTPSRHRLRVPLMESANLWFDSPATMEQAMNSPQMAAAVEDAKRFLDMERTYALVVDEKIVVGAIDAM